MPPNSIIRAYTQDLWTMPGSSDWDPSGGDGQNTSQLARPASNPQTFSRLFPSMHTLSSLSSIRDPSRYSGKKTMHFEEDVGIMARNSAHIGHGAQFDVRRVKMCCDEGFYVQKSALSAAYRKRSTWRKTSDGRQHRHEQEEEHMIRAVFLEYRALSHPPIREHPNIVDLLDLGWETDPVNGKDKWPVLILEYADQGTMTALFGRSQFSLETRTKLCLDVARGLTVLHESGITHGDLKMDNILIFTNKGVDTASIHKYTAKLADFGASLVEMDGKRSPSHSKPWNAPECFGALDFHGLKQLDVYSFGLLCWAVMLGGRNPFRVAEKVIQRLDPEDWDASLERLKKKDDGIELLQLAQESFSEAFGHLRAPITAIDATLRLEPATRDLPKAIAAFEGFLEPLRTEDEANATRNPATSVLDAPSICSHSVCLYQLPGMPMNSNSDGQQMILTSQSLQTYRGPLRAYLTEWLQEYSNEDSVEMKEEGVARSLLAELELDDWLDGRSADPSKVIAQYRARRQLFAWESAILFRLADTLPQEEYLKIVTADSLTESRNESFQTSFTPTLVDVFAKHPEWTVDQIWVPLVGYNAGVHEAPLRKNIYETLTSPNQTNLSSALSLAFPNVVGPALDPTADSCMEVDFTGIVLDERSGNFAIHILSQVGATALLQMLLKMPGMDINSRNKHLETPLLLACRAGRFSTAMLLVENGANVSLHNIFKENALHWLSSFRFSSGQVADLARAILAKGTRDLLTAEADYRPSMDAPEHPLAAGTPICRAIIKGFDEAARLLWDMEREAFAPARPAYSGIFWAARLHNSRLLDAFLEGPEDLVHPTTGASLIYAVDMGSLSNSSVGRVLRHGIRCGQSGVETLKVLCKYGANDHFTSIPGLPECNVLSLAVHECAPEVVKFLLEELDCARFVNVHVPPPGISRAKARGEDAKYDIEAWKMSPLEAAMLFDRPRIFELLLKHGADVNQFLRSEDGPLTPLHKAVILGRDLTYVKMLLATGNITNVDSADPDFESPFATAVRLRKFDIASCLLAHGADPNHQAVNGVRSFPVAQPAHTVLAAVLQQEASLSSLACVSFLLRTGRASPWTNQALGHTVLHALAMSTSSSGDYHEEFARRAFALLDGEFHFGREILDARKEPEGWTALESAVSNDNAALVEMLLHAGAEWDTVLPNPKGRDSPLVSAMQRMFHFPRGVLLEGDCPPKEQQLEMAFSRRRHICLMLSRKARERALEMARETVRSEEAPPGPTECQGSGQA